MTDGAAAALLARRADRLSALARELGPSAAAIACEDTNLEDLAAAVGYVLGRSANVAINTVVVRPVAQAAP